MANSYSKPNALLQLTTLSNKLLDSQHLKLIKNIVFLLVLYNYWKRFYLSVAIGGPVRAFNDFKAFIKKVTFIFFFALYLFIYIV